MKHLDNNTLIQEAKNLVKREKEIIEEILRYLEEIQERRLFYQLGFSSLFDFCIRELGYSEGAAHRRISSMRLARELPEANEKLKSGEVNISTLSQLQRFINTEEKRTEQKMNKEEKLQLLEKISNKSQKQCEREFLVMAPDTAKTKETVRPINTELTELKIVADENLMRKLNRLKEVLSHRMPNATLSEILDFSLSQTLKKEDPLEQSKVTDAVKVKQHRPHPQRRYIPKLWKVALFKKAQGRCQYTDPTTKRRCESRKFLDIDHKTPLALGGRTVFDNLQILCRGHNTFAAKVMGLPVPNS